MIISDSCSKASEQKMHARKRGQYKAGSEYYLNHSCLNFSENSLPDTAIQHNKYQFK